MNRFLRIWPFLCLGYCIAAVALTVSSCDMLSNLDGKKEVLSVSVRQNQITSEANSLFVEVEATGAWTLKLEFEEYVEPWAELNTLSGTGNKSNIILKYKENISEENRSLKIILTATSGIEYCVIVQTSKWQDDNPGVNPDPGTDPNPGTGPDAIPGWMELPAQTSGLDYYNHHFMLNGKRVRNYSLGWDGDSRLAHWVAYPLCSMYLGSQKRTDEWAYDPKVPESEQPLLSGSYKHPDLDRGHQLPSNDRTCNRDANVQTFYFSNMTPQVGKQLNQSIWMNLEGKVNSISKNADTLYVVTGCIVDGSTRYVDDCGGKSCIVPTGYFKALLYYNKNSTLGVGGYSGAAFYLENRSYSESAVSRSHCMSIDKLEEMTGLDFFVNLPDAIEAAVEKEDPSDITIWW